MFFGSLNFFKRIQSRLVHSYSFKMDKAYLRHISDTEQFQITFRYNNPEHKVDRQFNFSRQLSETVSVFLSRVTTNVEKVLNKKAKRRKKDESSENVCVAVTVSLHLGDEKVADDTVCKDLFNQDNRVVLKLLGNDYDVIFNSPYVDNIALPSSILANFPTYPAKFESVHTNLKLSEFSWFKSGDKKSWERVGGGFTYSPSNAEIGHYLKFSCTPKNERSEGPSIETISEAQVSASPGLCPFDSRHLFTQQKCEPKGFRVVTYNILADLYCDSDYTRSELYPYCPAYALTIDYRKQLVLKEILGYNADIICLQEVDRKVYNYDLEPVLGMNDYGSHFTLKGGNVAEGLSCFYSNEKFELVDCSSVVLSERIQSDPIFSDIWEKVSKNDQLVERFIERKTVVQATVLRSRENQSIVVVANTHLYFHPDSDHIRLIQGVMCIRYIESVYSQLIQNISKEAVSVIFCGDFNSVPECGIYKLYTTGFVESDCIDWKSNESESVTDLSVKQPFSLGSACGTPKYTNYTSGFADCLDYIFYDTTKLEVTQVIPLPSDEELKENVALPSVVFPSDHVSLVADFRWSKK